MHAKAQFSFHETGICSRHLCRGFFVVAPRNVYERVAQRLQEGVACNKDPPLRFPSS